MPELASADREQQLHHLEKLLRLKGKTVEKELWKRISSGRGVEAKGIYFEPGVLREALARWESRHAQPCATTAAGGGAAPQVPRPKRSLQTTFASDAATTTTTTAAGPEVSPCKTARTSRQGALLGRLREPASSCKDSQSALDSLRRMQELSVLHSLARPFQSETPQRSIASQSTVNSSQDCEEVGRTRPRDTVATVTLPTTEPCAACPKSPNASHAEPEPCTVLESEQEDCHSDPEPARHDLSVPQVTSAEPEPACTELDIEPRQARHPQASCEEPDVEEPEEVASPSKPEPTRSEEEERSEQQDRQQQQQPAMGLRAEAGAGARETSTAVETETAPAMPETLPHRPVSGSGAGAATPPPQQHSVRELKELLFVAGLDISCCVEKAELQALYERLQFLRTWPLEELQACCTAAGGPALDAVDECACFLISSSGSGAGAAHSHSHQHEHDQNQQCSSTPPAAVRGGSSPSRPASSASAPGPAASSSASSRAPTPSTPAAQLPTQPWEPPVFTPPPPARSAAPATAAADRMWKGSSTDPPGSGRPAATVADAAAGGPPSDRESEASREAARILPLKRERYSSGLTWGMAVLGVSDWNVAAVQRGYRNLMRKLHPDKAGQDPSVAQAAEVAREAKDACQRGLSLQEPPSMPSRLHSTVLCATPGRRQFRLHWSAPQGRSTAPVRRYVVAVLDPAYGRALTVAVLEPDYNEELRRFIAVEELTSYVLSEEELQKMPSLWKQSKAIVQVAAANEAGQSQWSVLHVPLQSTGSMTMNAKGRGSITPASGRGDVWRTGV